MLWRVTALIASVVETLLARKYIANVQMLIVLYNHNCKMVDIGMQPGFLLAVSNVNATFIFVGFNIL